MPLFPKLRSILKEESFSLKQYRLQVATSFYMCVTKLIKTCGTDSPYYTLTASADIVNNLNQAWLKELFEGYIYWDGSIATYSLKYDNLNRLKDLQEISYWEIKGLEALYVEQT